MNFKKIIKDVLEVVFVIIIIYFFIFGAIKFYETRMYCDFTQKSFYNFNYTYTDRISLVNVGAYVNITGLFDNGYMLSSTQFIDNCSFKK